MFYWTPSTVSIPVGSRVLPLKLAVEFCTEVLRGGPGRSVKHTSEMRKYSTNWKNCR